MVGSREERSGFRISKARRAKHPEMGHGALPGFRHGGEAPCCRPGLAGLTCALRPGRGRTGARVREEDLKREVWGPPVPRPPRRGTAVRGMEASAGVGRVQKPVAGRCHPGGRSPGPGAPSGLAHDDPPTGRWEVGAWGLVGPGAPSKHRCGKCALGESCQTERQRRQKSSKSPQAPSWRPGQVSHRRAAQAAVPAPGPACPPHTHTPCPATPAGVQLLDLPSVNARRPKSTGNTSGPAPAPSTALPGVHAEGLAPAVTRSRPA